MAGSYLAKLDRWYVWDGVIWSPDFLDSLSAAFSDVADLYGREALRIRDIIDKKNKEGIL